MKKLLLSIFVVTGILFLASCNKKDNQSSETFNPDDFEIIVTEDPSELSDFEVDPISGQEFVLTNMYPDKNITISLISTNGTYMLAGVSAVNNYFADFTIKGNTIAIGNIGSTRKAGPEEDMNIETEYLNLLNSVGIIFYDGQVLSLETTNGVELLFVASTNK